MVRNWYEGSRVRVPGCIPEGGKQHLGGSALPRRMLTASERLSLTAILCGGAQLQLSFFLLFFQILATKLTTLVIRHASQIQFCSNFRYTERTEKNQRMILPSGRIEDNYPSSEKVQFAEGMCDLTPCPIADIHEWTHCNPVPFEEGTTERV
jgi:hypothetical protein